VPRQRRFFVPEQPLHVIQRGNNRCTIFTRDEDYLVFRDRFADACRRYDCLVHAYVLMTNHVHLLMTPRAENSIASVMQSVGPRYVRYFNDRYGRTGTLWEGRYRAALIDSDRYLFSCYRYIEMNPVRAGLVSHPRQYRWSSYSANALGQPDVLVAPHERLCALGDDSERRTAAYRALFDQVLDEQEVTHLRGAGSIWRARGQAGVPPPSGVRVGSDPGDGACHPTLATSAAIP
jgi:putative transposase